MSREIKYLLPDSSNGKWNWTKDAENYNVAIPKTLDALQIRVEKVLTKIWKTIQKAIQDNVQTNAHAQDKYTRKIVSKTKIAAEEFSVHLFMLTDFQRKITDILSEGEGSPLMSLKKMDSPISRRKNNTLNYERMDSTEILKRLKDYHEILENYCNSFTLIDETWAKFIHLSEINDPETLIMEMKRLRMVLETLPENYRNSVFYFDDVTKGVLKRGIRLRINHTELETKLHNAMMRSLLGGCLDYRHSSEKQIVEQIIFRLKELDLFHPEKLPQYTLIKVKLLLETEAKQTPSQTLCYKKIGELHQNLHQKLFLIDSLGYLRNYWSLEMLIALDLLTDSLSELHQQLKFSDEKGEQLELYIEVLQDLLMQSQSGNEYFVLNNKLHSKHLLLASHYDHVDKDHLETSLLAISDDTFLKLLASCEHFIGKLQVEKVQGVVEKEAIEKIGWALGKTVMIDTYEKAVADILANLGTFISNTLHVLVGEILTNLPKDSPYRENLFNVYKISSETLARL